MSGARMYGAFHPDAQKGAENDNPSHPTRRNRGRIREFSSRSARSAPSPARPWARTAPLRLQRRRFLSASCASARPRRAAPSTASPSSRGTASSSARSSTSPSPPCAPRRTRSSRRARPSVSKEKKHALCSVPKCFDILNAELGKVSKDEAKQQSMKNVVITQFYDLCYPHLHRRDGQEGDQEGRPRRPRRAQALQARIQVQRRLVPLPPQLRR